ncbi:MAG: peptidoglycan DD-metalloendopeptidase family protein [Chloroflexi bacterium]|nr:peptidoglycan DD-metalloendopeptidase family protein [Chloroflexota bacterium]
MLKALAGVRHRDTRARPATSIRSIPSFPAFRLRRRAMGVVRGLIARAAATTRAGLGSERILPVGAALLVLVASMASFQPPAAVGGTTDAASEEARIAVGGIDGEGVIGAPYDEAELESMFGRVPASARGDGAGVIVDDGTLYKPVLPETQVIDGKRLLRRYIVKAGDTLTGIASQQGVSMMTIWWANKLKSKDDLHIGQSLVIPPVNGLVVTVKDGDTLEGLARTHKVDAARVVEVNHLQDTNLVIGQVLILPGAVGAPIPEAPKPPVYRSSGGSVGSGVGGSYTGGRFAWPVVGGNNYISQYYHYGHYAIDIAATYGSRVVSAAGGTVVYSGWRNNGGGYQVWVSHGGNLYTGYFHMSSLSVSRGQSVGKGQQVGRIGQSGWATGPHLHFVVSIGPIEGGRTVNPLRYY